MVRPSTLAVAAVSVLGVFACADPARLSSPLPSAAKGPIAAAPGRYLVGFTGTPSISAGVLAASGGAIVDSIPELKVLVVDGVTNPDALKAAQPRYVESGFDASIAPIANDQPVPDAVADVPGQQNTPWFATNVLWGMKDIHADAGWSTTSGGAGVNACILDTGVDSLHQELKDRVTLRANFVTAEPRIDDPNGHGSHVSGTVAGSGVVISGVAPRANIMSSRVLNAAGSGAESAIINGMMWCVDNGAHVINISLGGVRYKGSASYNNSIITYSAAVKYATDAGTVVLTAAGNNNLKLPNPAEIFVPAQIPGTIIIGATGPLTKSTAPNPPGFDPFDPAQVWRSPDFKAYYSNFGTGVNVFAPGGRGTVPLSEVYRFVNRVAQGGSNDQIWSVCSSETTQAGSSNSGGAPAGSASCLNNPSRYIAYAGTSMATPHVTGMAAVLYGELGGVRSATNRARVEACIKNTTDNIGPSATYGGGRVNVESALAAMRNGSC